MKKNQLLVVILIALASMPLYAQKVKIERENIFLDKADKLVYEAAYKAMQPDETYAFAWNYDSPLPEEANYLFNFGKRVKLEAEPDYTFEYYVSKFADPKIEYIKVKEQLPSTDRLKPGKTIDTYIARLTYTYECSVKILNKQKEVIKTFLISDNSKPYVYYYWQSYENGGGSKSPKLSKSIDERYRGGWLTAELLAVKMAENQEQLNRVVNNEILKDLFGKARNNIFYMMSDTKSGLSNGRFKMLMIKEKQQKDFPELAAQLADLRNCFIQWARDKEDVANLNKLATFAADFSQKAENTQDKKLKLLYHMNAALAYLMCKEYDKAVIQGGDGIKCDKSALQMSKETVCGMYGIMKKLDYLKQPSDTINGDIDFDLERDYRKLKEGV